MIGKPDCEICCGRGTVRLPIYARARVFCANTSPEIEEASRDYPCPECAERIPVERLFVAKQETFADSRYAGDPNFIEHVRHSLAHKLTAFMLRHNFISFERGPADEREMRFEMRATVGVVSKKNVASLDERVAERQIEIAQEVAAEAKEQIGNWGSFYGHADILKQDAYRLVDDSIKKVLAKRAAWRRE